MKMKTHSVYIRMMSLLLAVLCIVGLFPASALAASPNTIKLEDCTYNGVHYDSPALGICYMHQMQFDFNGDSVMGFCSEKGKGMGWSLEGHEWNSPKEINDSTVKIMMAYFYCHTKGIFTDRAQALGLDEVWGSDYTWTMNAWVQAVVWRYRRNSYRGTTKQRRQYLQLGPLRFCYWNRGLDTRCRSAVYRCGWILFSSGLQLGK